MKFQMIVLFALSLSIPFQTIAEEIGSIQIGPHIMIDNTYHLQYGDIQIETTGIGGGFLFPINLPIFDWYYNVRVAIHKIESVEHEFYDYYKGFATGINEFLFGKIVYDSRFVQIQPLVGVGFIAETIYRERGDGIVWDTFFIDFSCMIKHQFDSFGVGLIMNYESSFSPSEEDYAAFKRFNVGIIVSK